MNEILKLLETRNLYVYLILFKIYMDHNGMTKHPYSGDLRKEIKEFLGSEYTNENYTIAEEFLKSQGYVEDMFLGLTAQGRLHFEDWVNNFQNLNEDERKELNTALPPKAIDFFGLADKATKVLGFISKLLELTNKI